MSNRIDRKLIDGILDGDDAEEAVYRIAEYVVPRDGSDPDWIPSRPESNFYLVMMYIFEVLNGGHSQFFFNSSGGHAERVSAALAEMGLFELREILAEACSIFPGTVPVDGNERLRELPDDEAREAAWDRQDRRLYDREQDAYRPMLEYLRRHRAEILAAETA